MSCCAPCSYDAIRKLKSERWDFTVLFFNPNIYPFEEYTKRLNEQIKLCKRLDTNYVIGDYNHLAWKDYIKGLENEPECGSRCQKCFEYRAKFGIDWAIKNGFTAITSVFGTSKYKSQKQADYVFKNDIIKYISFDFDYIPDSDLYHQKYCGCEFSETYNGKT